MVGGKIVNHLIHKEGGSMEPEMMQITVLGFNQRHVDYMRKIYSNVLLDDPVWHFFWEGRDTYIRCQPERAAAVGAMLNTYCFKHHIKEYEENISIAKKYIEEFIPLFHNFSVLAMKVRDDGQEFMQIMDRLVHCPLNVFRTDGRVSSLGEFANGEADKYWESMVLSLLAAQRAFVIGYISRNFERKKEVDDVLDNLDNGE